MSLNLKDRARRVFGEDAFEWFSRSYLVDWAIVGLIWAIGLSTRTIPVTVRDAFTVDDPLIQRPHRKNQVSSGLNQLVSFGAPALAIILVGLVKRSLMVIHHGILGLFATRGLTTAVVDSLKNRIGRLRPDFLTRCEWDAQTRMCTGNLDDITEGRRSFPSGHSATAWSGMFFLSLFLAGQLAAWWFHSNRMSPKFLSSRVARFTITLLPLIWATHVALSRLEDNRHHKEDVIVGSLLGVIAATLCYLIFWPSPTSAADQPGEPRHLYDTEEHQARDRVAFELAAVDDPTDNQV